MAVLLWEVLVTDFIYLETLSHTCTWFMVKFLRDHVKVAGFIPDGTFNDCYQQDYKLHHNLTPDGDGVMEQFVPGYTNLLMSHILAHTHCESPHLDARQRFTVMTMKHPLVVCLRDPLLAMITHKTRIPDFADTKLYHKMCIWKLYFVFLEHFEQDNRVTYFPIDLLIDPPSRTIALEAVQLAYDLHDPGLAAQCAASWPVYNSAPDTWNQAARHAYNERDLDWFRKLMGKELAALQESEDVLRPLLSRLGYKDLLWWS